MSANATIKIDRFARMLVRQKARQLVGRAGITKSDVPDIEQEMLADLIERLPKYNDSKGMKTTFAARVVEHRISTIIRHRLTEMRYVYRESCSLDEFVEGGDDSTLLARHETLTNDERRILQGAPRNPENREHLGSDLASVLAVLPEELRMVCDHLLTLTPAETARRMGMPRTTLYERIEKLRAVFRAADLHAYL